MLHPISQSLHLQYSEVAIADLTHFHIAVLTTTQRVNRKIFSVEIPVPTRHYQAQGWIIFKEHLVASFDKLVLGDINASDTSFAPIRRLAPAIPISFEVSGAHSLPDQVSACASLSCNVPGAEFPYLSLFHQLCPRFVAVYPFTQGDSLVARTKQMKIDMHMFIQQNAHRLKKVPFYKNSFNL
ncbi:MAG: hypothetical protein AAGB13_05755 [Cyanobacteria bacterium P01_F01_bin.33]